MQQQFQPRQDKTFPGTQAHVLNLPYPIRARRYWANRTVKPKGKPACTTTYATPEAKAYKAHVQKLALMASIRQSITGRVRVECILYSNRPQEWLKGTRKDGTVWDDTAQRLDLRSTQRVVQGSFEAWSSKMTLGCESSAPVVRSRAPLPPGCWWWRFLCYQSKSKATSMSCYHKESRVNSDYLRILVFSRIKLAIPLRDPSIHDLNASIEDYCAHLFARVEGFLDGILERLRRSRRILLFCRQFADSDQITSVSVVSRQNRTEVKKFTDRETGGEALTFQDLGSYFRRVVGIRPCTNLLMDVHDIVLQLPRDAIAARRQKFRCIGSLTGGVAMRVKCNSDGGYHCKKSCECSGPLGCGRIGKEPARINHANARKETYEEKSQNGCGPRCRLNIEIAKGASPAFQFSHSRVPISLCDTECNRIYGRPTMNCALAVGVGVQRSSTCGYGALKGAGSRGWIRYPGYTDTGENKHAP